MSFCPGSIHSRLCLHENTSSALLQFDQVRQCIHDLPPLFPTTRQNSSGGTGFFVLATVLVGGAISARENDIFPPVLRLIMDARACTYRVSVMPISNSISP